MKKTILLVLMVFTMCLQHMMAQPNGRRVNVSTLTPAQRTTLATAMYSYITKEIIEEHSCNTEYFVTNGASWSIHGPEMFMNWHREYLNEMEIAIESTLTTLGLDLLPFWDPASGIGVVSTFNNTDADCSLVPSSCNPGTCANPSGFPNSTTTTFPSQLTPSPSLNCSSWSSYANFSEFVRTRPFVGALPGEGYHIVGHAAAGGVMGTFKSPAAPMFWLWHAMIDEIFWDYQHDCTPNAELHIKDNTSDTGAEPSGGVLYLSQDIWVRRYQDSPTGPTSPFPGLQRHPYGSTSYANEGIHEDPHYSPINPNYVYVRLNNNTSEDFSGGRLHVYWSKASTGLNWPNTWDNYFPGTSTVLHGDEILPTIPGQIPEESNFVIPPIPAGTQFIMEVPWYTVPDPNDFTNDIHHFCLLARMVSSFDDMTVAEGPTLWQNVANNNNIAWRNVDIYNDPSVFMFVNQGGGHDPNEINEIVKFTGVFVANPFEEAKLTTLRFNPVVSEENQSFYDVGGAIFARMDKDLFARWEEGGMEAEGIEYLGETNERHYIRIMSPESYMGNMKLTPFSNHALEMGFCLERSIEPNQQFDYDVQQFDEEGIVGGERYEIVITEDSQNQGKITSVDEQLEAETNLVVSPNPANSFFTLSYNLIAKNDVSIVLFDLTGKVVSQQSSRNQNTGLHEQYFDVSNLAKGVYLLRVQMGTYTVTQKVIVH